MAKKIKTLIQTLQTLHPERQWGAHPLGDYDQYAEIDASDILVGFSDDEPGLENGLIDPYSTFHGEPCEPSHWGLSDEAAKLMQDYNKVHIAKYPSADGPRQHAQRAKADLDDGPGM